MSATISTILDTRRIKKTSKYPVKLRVTFERVTEYYQTIFDLTKDEWDKLPASRISNELQSIRDKLKEIERTSENAIKNLDPFGFAEFEKDFIQNNILFRKRKLRPDSPLETKDTYDFSPFHKKFPILLEEHTKAGSISIAYIRKLLREGRISSAVNYHCSYTSLKKFRGNVCFTAITPSYLNEYEHWLKSQDISKTTVGIYLRPLRALFNAAIEDGIIKKEKCYPFGRRKYQIPTSKNVKKSLD
ncbi:MAG: phage integrase SAM-like domain-containing protein [Ferruginibacter sp.]